MKVRDYRLHELSDAEFEDLVSRVARRWLGDGVTPFAPGRDGGRDARFNGTANRFPSETEPWRGSMVLQAKHTTSPHRSCSDADFGRLVKAEHGKIERLASDGLCDYYLLFTNRRLTGGADEKLIANIKTLGVKDAQIAANELLHLEISDRPDLQDWLPNHLDQTPFRFEIEEFVEVIRAFHDYTNDGEEDGFDSAREFGIFVLKSEKNKINGLTDDYYKQIVEPDSMPYFAAVKDFLRNPRNQEFKLLYHDAADEIRRKILLNRSKFDTFDHIFTFLIDAVQRQRTSLRGKRRLVSILMHYMYFNCDIGSKDTEELENAGT